jgi:hypothetical protein
VKELRIEASLERHAYDNLYSRHSSHTVLDMTDSEIDHYLNFCDSAFVSETSGENERMSHRTFLLICLEEFEPIRHMFHDNSRAPLNEHITLEVDPDLGRYEAGYYAVWYRLMLESAARLTGWPEDAISKTVELFERRLFRMLKRKQGGLPVV